MPDGFVIVMAFLLIMILFSLFADIIHSGESLCVKKDVRMPVQSKV